MGLSNNQQKKHFLMTERDLEILRFINTFGFCERPHLEEKFDLTPQRFRDCMKRLKGEELVIEASLFHKRPKIYRLTKKGARYTDLPPLLKIPLALYHHEITVVDVALKLMSQYKEALWKSERYLKRERREAFEKFHIADGLLILPEGKKIAIEVELTLKDPRRLNEIFKKYALEFDIEEVWYFCEPLILKPLQKASEKLTFIKFFDLTTILGKKDRDTKTYLS